MATSPLLDRSVITSVTSNRVVWDVWKTWTSSTTTATNVWPVWTQGSPVACEITATSSVTDTWYQWTVIDGIGVRVPVMRPVMYEAPRRVVTPEQAAQEERWRQQREAEAAQRRAAEAAVRKKAEQTLLTLLTPEQEKAWREERAIFVTSQSGRRFKIKEGMTHNFHELDEFGQAIKEFCVHVSYESKCPPLDNVIAQLLGLKFNEAELIKLANIWDISRPKRTMIQRGSDAR